MNSARDRAEPRFPGPARKNDALFAYGCDHSLPWVQCYEQHETEIVHGPSCRKEQEINLDLCDTDGIAVQARRGGGGTVVLSPGMVIILVVGPRQLDEEIRGIFERVHRAITSAIRDITGVQLRESGISDLAVGTQKVCGSSLYLGRKPLTYWYQSSLMVSNDLNLIDRYLSHPPREPDYRNGRAHHEFCTNLKQCGCSLPVKTVCGELQQKLTALLNYSADN